MSFFGNLIQGFLNLFRSAASKAWNSLSKDLQEGALTSTKVVQIIKTNIGLTYTAIVDLISVDTGFTKDQVNQFITAVGKDAGITADSVEKVYKALQDEANKVQTDNSWNNLWQSLAKFGANYLTKGSLDWVSLSYGIIQFAFEKLFK